jgi:hypothetical protein
LRAPEIEKYEYIEIELIIFGYISLEVSNLVGIAIALNGV